GGPNVVFLSSATSKMSAGVESVSNNDPTLKARSSAFPTNGRTSISAFLFPSIFEYLSYFEYLFIYQYRNCLSVGEFSGSSIGTNMPRLRAFFVLYHSPSIFV